MKAALELGRWTFLAPIGYLNAPRAMGKSLMLEAYATGRFTSQQILQPSNGVGQLRAAGQRK
jgi:hypothetical protein